MTNPLPLGYEPASSPPPRPDPLQLCHLIHDPGDVQRYTLIALRASQLSNMPLISYAGALFTGPHYYLHKPEGVVAFYLESCAHVLSEEERKRQLDACLAREAVEVIASFARATAYLLPKAHKARRPLSEEAKQKAAANLVKARAAKAAKRQQP